MQGERNKVKKKCKMQNTKSPSLVNLLMHDRFIRSCCSFVYLFNYER